MAHYIQLTLLSALPHVAAASLMSIKMFGWVGRVADGWVGKNVASAGWGDGFSVVDAFIDVDDGGNDGRMILVPRSTLAVLMGVGMMMLWFCVDWRAIGGERGGFGRCRRLAMVSVQNWNTASPKLREAKGT
jgi:hypothetical protein